VAVGQHHVHGAGGGAVQHVGEDAQGESGDADEADEAALLEGGEGGEGLVDDLGVGVGGVGVRGYNEVISRAC